MKKIILSLCLVLSFTGQILAQKKVLDKRLQGEVLEAPEWFAELEDIEHINYYEMLERWQAYLTKTPRARVKTPLTKQVIKHFQRWKKRYAPFVDKQGRIRLPKQTDFNSFVARRNSSEHFRSLRSVSNVAPWEVFAPLLTYSYKTKKLTPAQANVQRFAVAESQPNILYCGTETGMIFKTEDKGLHWTPAPKDFYFGGLISSLEVSRSNPNKVLASAGSVLWLSTDGGKHWTNITPTPHKFDLKKWRESHYPYRNQYKHIKDAIFDPENDNTILMGNDAGLYKSTDNGTSWKVVDYGQCFDIKWRKGKATVFALVKKSGQGVVLRKSDNQGDSFTTKAFNGFSEQLSSGRIAISDEANAEGYIYVWGCRNDGTNNISYRYVDGSPTLLKSTDDGETWLCDTEIPKRLQAWDKKGGFGYYAMVIGIRPENPESIIFGLINLYTSDDGGQTLKSLGGYISDFGFDLHSDMQDLKFINGETWLSTDGGIIHSSDFFRADAEARVQGIYASEMWGFDMGWNEDVMVGGRNHNGNMSQLDKYEGTTLHMDGSETSTGYVFLSNPRKVAFSDLGSTGFILQDDWHQEFPRFNVGAYPYESSRFGIGFKFDPRYAKSFYMVQQYDKQTLWKTVDDGESFVSLYRFNEAISAYAVSRSDPNKLVVGTFAHLYQSNDGGLSFTEMKNLPEELVNVSNYNIEVHPRFANEIWVSTENASGVYRTKDNGKTWEHLNKGLTYPETNEEATMYRFFLTGNEKNAVYGIAYVLRQEDEYYKDDESRIFYRDDTTDGWQDFSTGLPKVLMINRMLPFYKAGEVRIATKNGIWKRPLVDQEFRPIAQPVILNAGTGANKGEADIQFDSYSIVNQTNAQWEWKFKPQPLSVSNAKVRNPIVRIEANQSYDVTLSITTPKGTDTKTIKNMIQGSKPVPEGEDIPASIIAQEQLKRNVLLLPNKIKRGEIFKLYPTGLNQAFSFKLFNMQGELITAQTIESKSPIQMQSSDYPAGTYLYLIQSNEFKKVGKLVIH